MIVDGRCRAPGSLRAKERLATWSDGERVIERIIAEHIAAGTPHRSLTLRSYRCEHCGDYHVGHDRHVHVTRDRARVTVATCSGRLTRSVRQ